METTLPVLETASEPVSVVRPPQSAHLPVLDALRGLAALAVCWFHFTNAQFTELFPFYKTSGKYGYLGVQIFFVISGFVIPWSMYRANYQVTSFFRFLARRVVRLDPPYLASILVVLSGYFLSSMTPGHAHLFHIPWLQLLAHLGYVNVFLNMPWFQMSYWSLAVEFQYYLSVGLAFTLFARKGIGWFVVSSMLIIVATLGLGSHPGFLPHHLPLFLLGLTVFRFKCLQTTRWELACGVVLAAVLAIQVDGVAETIAGMLACLAILFLTASTTPLLSFLGRISYSLYLIHVFVGNVVYGIAARHAANLGVFRWILPPLALLLAVLLAYLFYLLIEVPSKRWSARIRYAS